MHWQSLETVSRTTIKSQYEHTDAKIHEVVVTGASLIDNLLQLVEIQTVGNIPKHDLESSEYLTRAQERIWLTVVRTSRP